MHTPGQLLLATLTAALALSLAVGTATASRGIQIEPLVLHIATSPEVVFTEEGGASFRCAVTLVASLHRTMAKVRDTLAGFVTEGRTERCTTSIGGTVIAVVLAERGERRVRGAEPWHIQYQSFAGTLPSITNVLAIVRRASLLIEIRQAGIRVNACLYQGDIGVDARGAGDNEIERIGVQERQAFALFVVLNQALRACARSVALAGTFTTTRRIGLRLI